MKALNESLVKTARRLLEGDDPVDFVLGHRRNTVLASRATPFYARTPEDCDRLVFDRSCSANLSGLVKIHHRRTSRFAVIAKGCDARGIAALVQEKQILREQVVVIGVECPGMVDAALPGDPSAQLPDRAETRLERRCLSCEVRLPRFCDILVSMDGTVSEQGRRDTCTGVDAPADKAATDLLSMSLDERWNFWREKLALCIRCHACRLACPLCSCTSCVLTSDRPAWVNRSTNPSDNVLYSMIRLWHLSGRCTGCGECERVCPAGIPFTAITSVLADDCKRFFGTRPGDDPEAKRVLSEVDEDSDARLADFII